MKKKKDMYKTINRGDFFCLGTVKMDGEVVMGMWFAQYNTIG